MNNMTTTRRHAAGFTLIELMCAVAITGILSSVAYPSYQAVVQKTRRCDALVAMMQLQMAQERFRSNNASYGSLSDIGVAETSPARHYALSVIATSASGYEARAWANGSQASDSACRYLKLTVDGFNVSHASGPDAHHSNSMQANKKCWSQ
jgi:type IV pilus assembly protein PilE